MRLTTTLKSETNVSALASRLYGDLSPETRKKAKVTPEIIAAGEKLLAERADAPLGSEFPMSVGGRRYTGRIDDDQQHLLLILRRLHHVTRLSDPLIQLLHAVLDVHRNGLRRFTTAGCLMDRAFHVNQALLQFVCLHHFMPPMRFPLRSRESFDNHLTT